MDLINLGGERGVGRDDTKSILMTLSYLLLTLSISWVKTTFEIIKDNYGYEDN